jgi:hypothetical protein
MLLELAAEIAKVVVLGSLARERVRSRKGLLRCGDPRLCCPATSFWRRPWDVASTCSCHDGICCKGQSNSPTPQPHSRSSLLRHQLRDRAGRLRSIHPVVGQMAGRSRIRRGESNCGYRWRGRDQAGLPKAQIASASASDVVLIARLPSAVHLLGRVVTQFQFMDLHICQRIHGAF